MRVLTILAYFSLLQVGVVSGLALAVGLYASFGNIARLFSSDQEVLMVVKSCALVNLLTLLLVSMSYAFFSNVNFRFSLSVPVNQLMPWHSSLMVYITVYQILTMLLKLLYVNYRSLAFGMLWFFNCSLIS